MTRNALNTMLCWRPGTSDVRLVPWPDLERRSAGCSTALACFSSTHTLSAEERQAHVFMEAMHLIVRDRVDPIAVHKALLGLEEYLDGCSDDMPGVYDIRSQMERNQPDG